MIRYAPTTRRDWQIWDWDVRDDTVLPSWLVANPLGGTTSFNSPDGDRGSVRSTGTNCGFQVDVPIQPDEFEELILQFRGVRATATSWTNARMGWQEATLAGADAAKSAVDVMWTAFGEAANFQAWDGTNAAVTKAHRLNWFFETDNGLKNRELTLVWRRQIDGAKTTTHEVSIMSYGGFYGGGSFTAAQVEDTESVKPYIAVVGTGTVWFEMTGVSFLAA